MKTIKYNNKTYTIPKPFDQCDFSDEPLRMETVSNPFSGESIAMPRFAVAVYDVIMVVNKSPLTLINYMEMDHLHCGVQYVKVLIGFVNTLPKNIWFC